MKSQEKKKQYQIESTEPEKMQREFSNPILETAVKSGRVSFEAAFKLEAIKRRCDQDDQALVDVYVGNINPYHQEDVARHNRLVNFVKLLDSDYIDMKQLRAFVFNGVPFVQQEYTLLYTESEMNSNKVSREEQLSHALRGISWRMLLGVLSAEPSKWPEELQRSVDGYEAWRRELVKDLAYMKQAYRSHHKFKEMADEDIMAIFEKDLGIAHKYHKYMRLKNIRNQRKAAPTAAQIFEDEEFENNSNIEAVDKELHLKWHEFFSDMDLFEEIQKDIRRTRSDLGFFIQPLDTRDAPKTDHDHKRLEM